jgi:hypothetical protein
MAANGYESELSQVAYLLDELAGKKWDRSWWDGYHPRVYFKADRTNCDQLVRELCAALQSRDVTQYSLEMQIWWRNHQAADKARCESDLAQAKTFKHSARARSKGAQNAAQ